MGPSSGLYLSALLSRLSSTQRERRRQEQEQQQHASPERCQQAGTHAPGDGHHQHVQNQDRLLKLKGGEQPDQRHEARDHDNLQQHCDQVADSRVSPPPAEPGGANVWVASQRPAAFHTPATRAGGTSSRSRASIRLLFS